MSRDDIETPAAVIDVDDLELANAAASIGPPSFTATHTPSRPSCLIMAHIAKPRARRDSSMT